MFNTTSKALKSFIITALAIFLFCGHLYSQKKTFSGYFITTKGDTTRGTFPGYSQWAKNPGKVAFVTAGASTPVELTPANCLKFYIDGYDEYVSWSGERLLNPVEFVEVMKNKELATFADQKAEASAFLRLATRTTNCEIYVLTDAVRTNLFYKVNGQPITELRFKMYLEDNKVNDVPEYRQQLNLLFKEDILKRNLSSQLEELSYTEETISRFIEKLFKQEQKKTKGKNPAAGFIISGGLSLNNFKVLGDPVVEQVNMKFATTVSPVIVLSYMVPFSRNLNRYFFLPQLKVYSYKNEATGVNNVLKSKNIYQAKFIVSAVLNLGLNVINKDNYKLFVSGGIASMYLNNNKHNEESTITYNNSTYSKSESTLSNSALNINVSTGVILKNKVTASATYTLPSSIGNSRLSYPQHSNLQLTLGYKF